MKAHATTKNNSNKLIFLVKLCLFVISLIRVLKMLKNLIIKNIVFKGLNFFLCSKISTYKRKSKVKENLFKNNFQ